MTDNSYFNGNESLNAFNAAQNQATAGSIGPFQATAGSGGMKYTDKELYQMQVALNEAAAVKQKAITNVQARTDATTTGNIDYFKQLTEAASNLLSPYRALATQGAEFYMNAIGANGPQAQQASLPQAADIFKQNSIDPTNYLSSIPQWSFNQASNQATSMINNMFGYTPQQTNTNSRVGGRSSQAQQNTQFISPTQQTTQQAPAVQNQAFPNQQTPSSIFRTSQQEAEYKAQQDLIAKQKADYTAGLDALKAKQGSYESDTVAWFDNQTNIQNQNQAMIDKLNSIGTGARLDTDTVKWLYSNRMNDLIKSDGTYDYQKARQTYMKDLQNTINTAGEAKSTSPELANYLIMQERANGVMSNNFTNPYDKQILDYQAKQAATNSPANSQQVAQQGQFAQAMQQINTPRQAATLQAQQLDSTPNLALQGLMNPFMKELNNRPDIEGLTRQVDPAVEANRVMNSLINPATGAVNNWINSDVVKNVMGATIGSGTNAVQNAAAAKGMLDSGQTLAELQKVGTNAAGQYIVPFAGQLANNVMTQGTSVANNTMSNNTSLANTRLNNYYSLLGKGADFANSMAQMQSNMTQNMAGQYNSLAGNALNTLQNNASAQAIAGQGNQLSGMTNLMNQGQQAATNTASMYGNLGTNAATQTMYNNDIYGQAQLQGANIEANRLSQFRQLQMQLDRANQAQENSNFEAMLNGGGSLAGLAMMAAGGGL